MRIGQVILDGPTEQVLVLPRLGGDVIIRARAVLHADMELFHKLCPEPKAPAVMRRGDTNFSPNLEDKSYLVRLEEHGQKRFAYICIKSLEPSDIEWEVVQLEKPNTWTQWVEELSNAGLSSVELQRVQSCVLQANALDEGKLKEARELFLRGMGKESKPSSGPSTGQESTQSGAPANVSE